MQLDAKLPVGLGDIAYAHFEGQMAESFKWSMELDRFASNDMVLCLKHWILGSDGTNVLIGSSGPVVALSIAGKGLMTIILEDSNLHRWVRLNLSPKQFSGDLNVDWIVRGEISVAAMGFFSKTMTAEKLTNVVGLLPVEILNGFQYVKTHMMKNRNLCLTPNSWKLMHEMELKGVFGFEPNQDLKADLVFTKQFDAEACRKWISDMRKPFKPSEKSALPPSKRKRKTPGGETKPEKKGRKSVLEKPVVEKELAAKERVAEQKGKRKGKSVDILPASDTIPDKRLRRKPVAVGTSLVEAANTDIGFHSSDDENPKEPEEKKVLEG